MFVVYNVCCYDHRWIVILAQESFELTVSQIFEIAYYYCT
jgi:hypothetical protein